MKPRSIWVRAAGRVQRNFEALLHAERDRLLLRGFYRGEIVSEKDAARLAGLLGAEARLPETLLHLLRRVCLVGPSEGEFHRDRERTGAIWPVEKMRPSAPACEQQALDVVRDEIFLFGRTYRLADAKAWHQDPLRSRPWPRRTHARIRLDDPDRPGDLRMQWEPARFHHGLLLARAYAATGNEGYAEAFLRQVDAFLQGNPPFRSIHWSVGMEVAIRASAWVLALALFRGSRSLTEKVRMNLTRALLLHGLFLETHIERHGQGFTTNHTLADYAGLAVLGRHFEISEVGQHWLLLAAAGLEECLLEQVLPSGAHVECSLPYERFVLETSLVAALCLPADDATTLRPHILRMARHLRSACLPSGIPFVGDGDDSFFPPFGFRPYVDRDPLQADLVLDLTDDFLGGHDRLLGESDRRLDLASRPVPVTTVSPPHAGSGMARFAAGPYQGLLVVRGEGEGWLPTHGHNDLLSIVLDFGGRPLLIDPGTGGYACDRKLRQNLRGTAAHSTLQLESLEQSGIRERATFEGPAAVPCALIRFAENPLRLDAWHEGFGGQACHRRRLFWRRDRLWIEDRLVHRDEVTDREGQVSEPEVTTHLRFRLAPECVLHLNGSICTVRLPQATLRFLLLRPRGAFWQIQAGLASLRYGSAREAPVLMASTRARGPHRWLTVLEHESIPADE